MSENDNGAIGNQLGCGVGGLFGLALLVLDQQFNLLAVDAALGVDILGYQLGGIDRGQAVRGQVTGMSTCHADLDGVGAKGRTGQQRQTHSDHETRKTFHQFLHNVQV